MIFAERNEMRKKSSVKNEERAISHWLLYPQDRPIQVWYVWMAYCKMHEKKMRTSLWSTMTNCFNYALLNAI